LLNTTPNIQQTNKTLQFIFLRQGQNGLFTLDLTPSSNKNGRKAIEGMKVRFRAIQVSKKGHTRKSHFFQGHTGKKLYLKPKLKLYKLLLCQCP
jgi:hypothetical protein